MRLLLTLLILSMLAACGSSGNKDNQSPVTTPPAKDATINISALPGYLIESQAIAIYELSADNQFVSQITLQPDENGFATAATKLNIGSIYKIVFNPNQEIINIRCPLRLGCIEYSYVTQQDEKIAYSQPLQTKLQLSAIVAPTTSDYLTINVVTELATQLIESRYFTEINPLAIATAQSAIANTFGLLGYSDAFNNNQESVRNELINQAINAGVIFDDRKVILNGSSRVRSVFAAVYQTLNNDNTLARLNDYYLQDADLYLQDIVLAGQEVADPQLLARVRSYLLAKNIYPVQGFSHSPYIELPDVEKSKKFLDDFRSILYTFADDTAGYEQVNDSVSDGYALIEDFSQQILVELFPLFNDILKEVPIGSTNGQYLLDGLTIEYSDNELSWIVKGDYQELALDIKVTVDEFLISAVTGNRFKIAVLGNMDTLQQQIALTDTYFTLHYSPADDPFSGEPDGSGSISVDSNLTLSQAHRNFTGQLDGRIELIKQPDGSILNVLESAVIYGKLLNLAQQEHQLSLAIVHPNPKSQIEAQLISDQAVISFAYSAPLKGLAEPLLTLFVKPQDIEQGLSLFDLDLIAYFAGRQVQFRFEGNSKTFTYQGLNQDGVQWDLAFDKKVNEGTVQ